MSGVMSEVDSDGFVKVTRSRRNLHKNTAIQPSAAARSERRGGHVDGGSVAVRIATARDRFSVVAFTDSSQQSLRLINPLFLFYFS